VTPQRTLIALAVLSLSAPAFAQTTPSTTEPQRVEVTGSLIKRIDRTTPSVVQSITREEIRSSGYTTLSDLLRANGAVDTGSISDGAASGFVGGLSTISLRGLGSQSTLILINGRRVAPVGAVDINFGRGSLVSVNTIPQGAVERVDILKDGASAMYGSDAMAGVINYILRKDYQGAEGTASYSANDKGKGVTKSAGVSFGFGNIDTQRFNVFGGLEVSKRDSVMFSDIKDRGNQALYDSWNNQQGVLSRFTPDSSASFYGNYYRVPTSLTGSTTINGISVANTNLSGANYLGTLPGCPDNRTVGKGVPNRPDGFLATTASLRDGFCRFNFDNADETIAAQDRTNAVVRGTFAISNNLTAFADLMYSRTKTTEKRIPYALTTTLVTSGNPTATTWPKIDGSFLTQNAIILPATHPDNPTRGTATAQPVQLIYRFEDLKLGDINDLKSTRLTAGVEGTVMGWDFESALLFNRQDNTRNQQDRVRSSLLNASIASGTYRFGGSNSDAAKASVASDAINTGKSDILSLDVRASREWFKMAGGNAAIAVGAEVRREKLESVPDATYKTGDYIGLVANGASGTRNVVAAFSEVNLPVLKSLEGLAAVRFERYSDFGNSTTGKLGFKWTPIESMLLFRGTAATGFRAPSISQISDSYTLSFHSFQERRVTDSLRCDSATFTSKANPAVNRDCNVLGFTAVPAGTTNPGSIPTVVAANKNLKPETSRSFTLGMLAQPSDAIDFGLDLWYFQRNEEIRVQRGADIMDAYNANPSQPAPQIVRDPNPQTWLPGIPNSGPIILLTRQYGNYKWTKTAGVDYDFTWRLPATEYGKFSVKLVGTYTRRYDRVVLEGAPTEYLVGTSTIDIPKSRGNLTFSWKTDSWNSWLRRNHSDRITTGTTATCLTSTSVANTFLRDNGYCQVGKDRTIDVGTSYSGFKNLVLTASVANINNNYGRSNGIPSVFTYWDPGLTASLGRRFNLGASYTFK
jgi:iron complex outermembrane receptor protein